jgi:tetratricopeptide (TPR) repeat protein
MLNPAFKSFTRSAILIIIVILGLNLVLSAQNKARAEVSNYGYLENNQNPGFKRETTTALKRKTPSKTISRRKQKLTGLQEQARLYRKRGLELQSIGDLENATVFYQKAIELDPAYAAVYNDLGVIYEAQGWQDRAEDSYLKAINIDPDYLSPYSNLALLYENKRQLQEAAFFWKRRAELGEPGDPWTDKASKRLEDINLVLGKTTDASYREQEVLNFMQDVSDNLAALKKKPEPPFKKIQEDNADIARHYFNKAKQSYEKADYDVALRQALQAQELDPTNKNVAMFIEELQRRLLSR